MKCYKCNKPIPSVSTVCPYCSAPVDPNYKEQIDFGDIDNTDYDQKNDLKAYIQEPKNRKVVLIGLGTIIFVIVIFVALILTMFKSSKDDPQKYFNDTIELVYDYLYDNYLGSNNAFSADYKLKLDINGTKNEFVGTYERDVKSRIFKLDGTMKDPNEASGGIILDSKDFQFDSYMKDNNLYFKSDQLFNKYFHVTLPDETGLLTTKTYSLDLLVGGISDALTESIKNVVINKDNTNINYRGVKTNVKKYYFVLDNKGKTEFLTTFYESLIDDANFINEYARINGKTADDITEILKNKINDAEFRYSGESNNKTTFAIYVLNKKIIRYYIEDENKEHKIYQLDIKDEKLFFDYIKDNENIISASILKTEETLNDELTTKYAITFDYDEYVMDIYLELKIKDRPLVKREEISDSYEFGLITEEDKNILKNNLSYYTSKTQIIDTLAEKFKEKCVVGIECNCETNEDTCSCMSGNEIITCDRDKVMPQVPAPINPLE